VDQERGADQATDRILTLPNVITLIRLCLLPVFLWLLFVDENRAAAAGLLAALGATDFLDGYIARHFHRCRSSARSSTPWRTASCSSWPWAAS
jgi:phosphatidylglycerophosphate synthase